MSLDRNDPRLTAYALDELPQGERAAFEAELAQNPSAQAEVEAIRAMAEQVATELRAETVPTLSPRQRRAVLGGRRMRALWLFPAAAALMLVGVLLVATEREEPVNTLVRGDFREVSIPSVRKVPDLADLERARAAIEKLTNENRTLKTANDKFEGWLRDFAEEAREATNQKTTYAVDLAEKQTQADSWKDELDRTKAARETLKAYLDGEGKAAVTLEGVVRAVPKAVDTASQIAVSEPGKQPLSGLGVGGGPATPAAKRHDSSSPLVFTSKKSKNAEDRVHTARPPFNTEGYDRIRDNEFKRTDEEDTSTFSIDVDTASYANVRRFLNAGRLPPKGAVRIEELVNYFGYDYAPPQAEAPHPFASHVEIGACPWNPKHRLARIALKGKTMQVAEQPPTNLVFLLDVSGSMEPANKLPLLKQAMQMLVQELGEKDRVAIVVYAGAPGLVLPSTPCGDKPTILAALRRLRAGGSTNGGAGIQLAYRLATQNFIKGGVNRVILATDGDFNVGVSDRSGLVRMIEEKAKSGVFLSVLGFGMGNYKDDRMEDLSNKGNGNYAYIDTLREARKVLVEQMSGTLVAIAKDVKIQIFFNPRRVAAWRLIGYANRLLKKQDFNDDTKDAGEIGAGHAVTALYELVPAGSDVGGPRVDPNPFVAKDKLAVDVDQNALLLLRLRYKQPDAGQSSLIETYVRDDGRALAQTTADFQWASAVAGFGMLLRDSKHKGMATWAAIQEIAGAAKGKDPHGYRAEFLTLVERAKSLAQR